MKSSDHHLETSRQPEMSKSNIDELIGPLLAATNEKPAKLRCTQLFNLCREASEVMFEEPTLLRLTGDYHIVGDIHGYYSGLLTIFNEIGHPGDDKNYLFLGDYVDKGPKSLETVILLMYYKVKYPKRFFLLRGNHEVLPVNTVHGFLTECRDRFGDELLFQAINQTFDYLPLAAIINNQIFCCHGGIPKDLKRLREISTIKRPLIHWKMDDLIYDLLWADPNPNSTGFEANTERKIAHYFGRDALEDFLKRYQFSMVCRGHQFVEDGFEFFHDDRLVTLFSAQGQNNRIGIMSITKDNNVIECVCISIPGFAYKTVTFPFKEASRRREKAAKEREAQEAKKLQVYKALTESKSEHHRELLPSMEQILEEPETTPEHREMMRQKQLKTLSKEAQTSFEDP